MTKLLSMITLRKNLVATEIMYYKKDRLFIRDVDQHFEFKLFTSKFSHNLVI